MKIERDERKFDFHGIGLAIKKAREREGMTQEQLGYIVDRDPRTIMYHENDGQHPSLNAFYQMVTMFGISVDEYFYPDDYSWALLHIFPLYCKYTLRKELLRDGVNKMFDFFGGVTPMLVSDNCVE